MEFWDYFRRNFRSTKIQMRLCKGYPGTREKGGKMGGNTGTFRKKVREHGNIALPISGTGNIIHKKQ